MAVPKKYQRLLEATQRYNSFHRLVDLVTLALFLFISVAIANKLLAKKLIEHEVFDHSWKVIGACAVVFFILCISQLSKEKRRRFLSAFQREAAIKAARKDNYKRR